MTKIKELLVTITNNPDAEIMIMHDDWLDEVHIGKDVNINVEFLTLYNDEFYINEDDLREKLEDDLWKDGIDDNDLTELVDEEIKKYIFKKYIILC